jgi:hypothetical protein
MLATLSMNLDPAYLKASGWILVGHWLDEYGDWEPPFKALNDLEYCFRDAGERYIDIPWRQLIGHYKILQNQSAQEQLKALESDIWMPFYEVMRLFAPVHELRESFDQGAPGANGVFVDYYTKKRTARRLAQYLTWTAKRLQRYLESYSDPDEEVDIAYPQTFPSTSKESAPAKDAEKKATASRWIQSIEREPVEEGIQTILNGEKAFVAIDHLLLHKSGVALTLVRNEREYAFYETPEEIRHMLYGAGFDLVEVEERYPEDMGHVFILARGSAIGWRSRRNIMQALDPKASVDPELMRRLYLQESAR